MTDTHNDDEPTRRNALAWMTWLSGATAAVAAAVPIVGYLFGPLRRREDGWASAGKLEEFPVGEIRLVALDNPLRKAADADLGKVSAYVKRLADDDFQVLSVICTHLGCGVNWFPQARLFMCPCHGGAYYDDGSVASGPPPDNLHKYEWRVVDGSLEVKIGHLPTQCDPT
ncbi:MAG: ubiquinol-cytochrome c reductase iron-sulfur subunit [Planctomycetaceae bacterium]